ncbi:hypothetical protein BDW22DRAFT_1371479 [Trametopsis cervina]|nr:hypothetical protein BDW22DRAFT_1371479 [Trametopsis cervina]
MSNLQGWHHGERSIQLKLGFDGPMRMAYTWIEGEMPQEHRTFHTTRLPFVPVTTLDEFGRPWSCILAGPSGEPGFITSPTWNRLDMVVHTWPGDPLATNVRAAGGKGMLTAGIGIEFSTRRRNKFAGSIINVRQKGDTYWLQVEVNQAIGNCPKYINIRQLDPHPGAAPDIVYQRLKMDADERLPDEVIGFIRTSDTVFLGTTYEAPKDEAKRFPSHVGQNQRGGRPGFIRVKPSDGRTIVLPDFSGNRLLTSLGNIEATPLASYTFVNFVTGDILYLTGDARVLVGQEAQAVMPRQNALTELYPTGFVLVRDALPVRQRPGTEPERSPYSPPIRLLAEESPDGASMLFDKNSVATLVRVQMHSSDLATFTWETSRAVHVRPGQTAVLDFSELVGAPRYAHMAPTNPTSVNDDRIRTWTISSAHLSPEGTKTFDLTMREKPGGTVTGALFTIARKIATSSGPNLLNDLRPIALEAKLVGIAGSFTFRESKPHASLWLAGGIGVTPFMSMLAAIMQDSSSHDAEWDVVLGLATREPDVLLPLLLGLLEGDCASKLRIRLHVFSNRSISTAIPDALQDSRVDLRIIPHTGRVDASFLDSVDDIRTRVPYICGPEEFERGVLTLLGERGVPSDAVVRESFEY